MSGRDAFSDAKSGNYGTACATVVGAVTPGVSGKSGKEGVNAGKEILEEVTKYDRHHVLPQAQEFRKYFHDAKLDIHKFSIIMPQKDHRALHSGKGMGRGGAWNNEWRDFFLKYNIDGDYTNYR